MDVEKVIRLTLERSEKCFLCHLIYQDLKLHGKLTGHPLAWSGEATFPVSGKTKHLELEGFLLTSQ